MIEPLKISRDLAHERGLKRFYTGVPCKHGHYAERYVVNGGCTLCVNRATPHNAKPIQARNAFWPKRSLIFTVEHVKPEEMEAAINMVQAFGWLDECVRMLRDGRQQITAFLDPPSMQEEMRLSNELARMQSVRALATARAKGTVMVNERVEPELAPRGVLRHPDADKPSWEKPGD